MAKKKREKKKGKTQPKDKLTSATLAKEKDVKVADRKLRLFKWSLRQSMRLGSKVADIIRKIMPTTDLANLMRADFSEVFTTHEDDIIQVLAESVERENFETTEEATEWVETLGLEEALELFVAIAELNLRPLILKVQTLASKLGVSVGAAAKTAGQDSPTS